MAQFRKRELNFSFFMLTDINIPSNVLL